MVGTHFMSPQGIEQLGAAIAAQQERLRQARLARMVGKRVRSADGNEGRVEMAMPSGRVVIDVDRGPFAGAAYLVDASSCEVITP